MEIREWYKKHTCDHVHCPHDCEHPQPFIDGEDLYCGRCACIDKVLTKMAPCGPENCGEEND